MKEVWEKTVKLFFLKEGLIEMEDLRITIIVTLSLAVLSTTISIIVAIVNSRRLKKTTFINTVTASRIQWMDEMKTLINDYISCTKIDFKSIAISDSVDFSEYLDKISNSRMKIVLHLNYLGYIDKKITICINEISLQIKLLYESLEINSFSNIELIKYFFTNYGQDLLYDLTYKADKEIIQRILDSYLYKGEESEKISEKFLSVVRRFQDMNKQIPRGIINKIEDLHYELIMLTKIYMKEEWKRVKAESNGKIKKSNCIIMKKKKKTYIKMIDTQISEYNSEVLDYSSNILPARYQYNDFK